jgi:hypothetical protein
MESTAHVPVPKKFACQNKVLVAFLPTGEFTLASFRGQIHISLKEPVLGGQRLFTEAWRYAFYKSLVPPILAAQIFPPPGQRRRPIL